MHMWAHHIILAWLGEAGQASSSWLGSLSTLLSFWGVIYPTYEAYLVSIILISTECREIKTSTELCVNVLLISGSASEILMFWHCNFHDDNERQPLEVVFHHQPPIHDHPYLSKLRRNQMESVLQKVIQWIVAQWFPNTVGLRVWRSTGFLQLKYLLDLRLIG